jgi:hypothetical protein
MTIFLIILLFIIGCLGVRSLFYNLNFGNVRYYHIIFFILGGIGCLCASLFLLLDLLSKEV